jgi:hypothetical protein
MTNKKYTLTDEHRARLPEWRDKWIANAMSTCAMDDTDRDAVRVAVKGLYEAAGLTPPPEHRIVFVSSPFVLRFAAGFAAWIWYRRKYPTTFAATFAATRDVTLAATHAATDAATHAATDAATDAATRDATFAATDAATRDATFAATDAATRAATRATRATRATGVEAEKKWYTDLAPIMHHLAFVLGGTDAQMMLQCANLVYRMWLGGNQWSGWCAYLSFFRHVAQLKIDYSKWQHYESMIEHAGPFVLHSEFAMISDRPECLTVDDQNRPHGENRSFCRWRDGTELFSWHGVRVPRWTIEYPERITAALIHAETNQELRRAMTERMGWARYLAEAGARQIHQDETGEVLEVSGLNDGDAVARFVHVKCPSTGREYTLRVPPQTMTAREGVAWTFDVPAEKYQPGQET